MLFFRSRNNFGNSITKENSYADCTDDNEMLQIRSFLCYSPESIKCCTLNFQVLLENKLL